jgi:hypothetical protein
MEWGWAAAVGTLLVGQLALIGVEWARHWIERDQRRRDARDDLQRQTLMSLQEALTQYLRGTHNALHEYKQLDKGQPVPEWHELENPRLIAGGLIAKIMVLTERVDDPEIRGLVGRFSATSEEMLSSDDISVEGFEGRLAKLWLEHQQVNKRIGEVLRKL